MKKRKGRVGRVLVMLLAAALLSSTALAAEGQLKAVVRINTGKLLLINPDGERIFCEGGEKELLLTPQTRVISLEGTSVVEVEDSQLILDQGDELAYESEIGRKFRCLSGAVEAVSGDRTYKLSRGEVIALNSPSAPAPSQQVVASRARVLEKEDRFLVFGLLGINPPQNAPGGILPYQGGPYIPSLPWKPEYAQQSSWASASPYW